MLIYGYATGVFSSRKIERATHDSIAFRYLAANTHPDHDTIAAFRLRFLPQLESLFAQVLLVAREMKLMKLGRIALDGTKVKANAIEHNALSYGHARKIEAQLKVEVSALTAQAEAADQAPVVEEMDGRIAPGIAPPGLPKIRTCRTPASGSSSQGNDRDRRALWTTLAGGSGCRLRNALKCTQSGV